MIDTQNPESHERIGDRFKLFLNPFHDGRYEDMRSGWKRAVFRDFTAGLIVAMVAIPLAMGFAIASGLNPVHGIVGGAFAGLMGSLFGGSKFQVYGPTAAYIPIIFGVMVTFGGNGEQVLPEMYATGYGVLVLISIFSGIILACMGLFGLGQFVSKVPHSIVVGFTIGIALTIALTQVGDVLGIKTSLPYPLIDKIRVIAANIGEFNIYALLLTVGTFLITKYLLKISIYIPGPLIAIGAGFAVGKWLLPDGGLTVARDKYGPIPTEDFFKFTPPVLPEFTAPVVLDILFYTVAIVFVAAIESLLCSRMADRLAENKGTPFNPNKELFGQGMVNTLVPLMNGFPHTGALARTATNIKVGGMTPLAGIFKCWTKLAMAFFLAVHLDLVPMACIAGILAYVAMNMVKWQEVKSVHAMNRFHIFLMYFTAAVVLLKDFLTGVLSALIIYAVLHRFFDKAAQVPAVMQRFRHLMVGLTDTKPDSDLIRYAAMLARCDTVVEVRFVHVLPNHESPAHDLVLEEIDRLVADSFLNLPDSIKVYCDVFKGPRLDRLLSYAAEQEVDLILVGRPTDQQPAAGSLVQRLAMKAPCSVWIVPDDSPLHVKKILVPIDFSEHSADAMLVATSMARLVGDAECLPLHVYVNDAVLTYEEYEPIAQGEEKQAYDQFVAPIDCRNVNVTPLFVEGGDIAHTIHRVASEQSVDLKVMSTRGRSSSAAILLGSVTEGVIREARTPVLVVKHFGAQLGLLQLLLDRTFKRRSSPHF